VSAIGDKKDAAKKKPAKSSNDQQRLRENLKSLKGTAEEKALASVTPASSTNRKTAWKP